MVGAGAAGLGAARRLADNGLKVVVLEARNRIGGRMFTDRSSMGIPIERGAELIHGGPHASTWKYVQEANIRTAMFTDNYVRLDETQPWHNPESLMAYSFPKGMPAGLAVYDTEPLPTPDPGEMAEHYLVHKIGITDENWPTAVHFLAVDSEPLYNMAATSILDTLADCIHYTLHPDELPEPEVLNPNDPEHDDGDYRVIGGYDQVLRAVARPVDVLLNTVVKHVEYTANGVVMQTSRGAIKSARALIAVPAGVLKRDMIVFDPVLPADKLALIDQFQYRPIFKCLLEFDHKVLTINGKDFGYAEPLRGNPKTLWNASIGAPRYKGQVITGWVTGAAAAELLQLSQRDRYRATLDVVRKAVGDNGLKYKNAVMHDWAQDPFAWGAYGRGVGSQIYKPVDGVIYWAGIQTSSIHASYNSGVAQADLLLANPPVRGWSQRGRGQAAAH
ncbi:MULTISPECIES: flavin monoamine oxidase family protein [Mumia]|uniref:Flavin monoamine oxidase family protein n=1 Tax=Mumia xiangluensis TaxID=1678900 RepID=A0ABW1QPM7_9ACTN|nr:MULTISPECIES: NAD(P)/FAD-dependent oxidoreductase [Mumia]